MDQPTILEPTNFEQALARLEAIAALLDRNEAPLADALQLCAEAATLTRYCRTQLADAEGKFAQLIETANGDIRLEPLDEG